MNYFSGPMACGSCPKVGDEVYAYNDFGDADRTGRGFTVVRGTKGKVINADFHSETGEPYWMILFRGEPDSAGYWYYQELADLSMYNPLDPLSPRYDNVERMAGPYRMSARRTIIGQGIEETTSIYGTITCEYAMEEWRISDALARFGMDDVYRGPGQFFAKTKACIHNGKIWFSHDSGWDI